MLQVSVPEQEPQFSVPQTGSQPHSRPAQLGVQSHTPVALQTSPAGHVPQETLQTGSGPHSRPAQSRSVGQSGEESHVPPAVHVSPTGHVPHSAPHSGSGPHSRPTQSGVQSQFVQLPQARPVDSHVWEPIRPPPQEQSCVEPGSQTWLGSSSPQAA
jgi:hypothetical protein